MIRRKRVFESENAISEKAIECENRMWRHIDEIGDAISRVRADVKELHRLGVKRLRETFGTPEGVDVMMDEISETLLQL